MSLKNKTVTSIGGMAPANIRAGNKPVTAAILMKSINTAINLWRLSMFSIAFWLPVAIATIRDNVLIANIIRIL